MSGFRNARIGAISFFAIMLSTACFPIVMVLPKWAHFLSSAVILVAGISFAPAITCSVYSLFSERPRWVGLIGVILASVTIYFEPNTFYFAEMGLASVPLTLVVMIILIKRRDRNRGLTIY